jgi:hypothetical protein
MKVLVAALIVGIMAVTGHMFVLDYQRSIAYRMAPPEPEQRVITDGLAPKINLALRLAKSQVRGAEAEFISIKNLYENGLISEEDFTAKKQQLQAKIQKNL